MSIKLQWERSSNKRIWEKGSRRRYLIYPNYMGTPKVQWYNIKYFGEAGFKSGSGQTGEKLDQWGYTQSDTKIAAQAHADLVEAKRQEEHKKFLEEEERAAPYRLLARRQEKFQVVAENLDQNIQKYDYDEIMLKTTTNGWQWIWIGLTLEEARKVVVALQGAIDEANKNKEES